MGATVDLTGKTFGKLTVLEKTDKRKNGFVVWKCICECGNITYKSLNLLTQGKVTNCGCLRRKRAIEMGKNRAIDITGKKFGRLTAIKPTEQRDGTFIIWKCECECGNISYVNSRNLISGNTLSCGCFGLEISKQNADKNFIEYKENTFMENTRLDIIGRKKLNKNNTTGYTGVYKRKKDGKYTAKIEFQGKRYYLGSYFKKEDAADARKLAEEKLHSDFLEWYKNEYKKLRSD